MAERFPEVGFSFGPLRRMLTGGVPARLLLTGIDLGVFSTLAAAATAAAPATAEELARCLGTHPANTQIFLDALVANGLLVKEGGTYANGPLARTFLVRDEPTYLGDVFRDDDEWMQPALMSLMDLVCHGPPASGRPAHSISWVEEAALRANCQRAGVAQQAAELIGALPEFPKLRRMLDLGAGSGLIGLAIVASHPTLTSVLFDRPEVAAVARPFIREYGLEDRVTVVGGDFLIDSLGEDYDLIWTSYVLPKEQLRTLVARIRHALRPGGVYVSLAEGLWAERTQPAEMVNMMLASNLHAGRDLTFAEGEIAEAMRVAGFRSIESRRLDNDLSHGPAVIDIARLS